MQLPPNFVAARATNDRDCREHASIKLGITEASRNYSKILMLVDGIIKGLVICAQCWIKECVDCIIRRDCVHFGRIQGIDAAHPESGRGRGGTSFGSARDPRIRNDARVTGKAQGIHLAQKFGAQVRERGVRRGARSEANEAQKSVRYLKNLCEF